MLLQMRHGGRSGHNVRSRPSMLAFPSRAVPFHATQKSQTLVIKHRESARAGQVGGGAERGTAVCVLGVYDVAETLSGDDCMHQGSIHQSSKKDEAEYVKIMSPLHTIFGARE